jgi:hypothetical protein
MKSRSRCLNETRKMEKGEATNMTCDIMENVEASIFCRDGMGLDHNGTR